VRRARFAVLAAFVLLLAGCSTIPTTGAVHPGTTEAPNGTRLVYVPNPPSAGASPQQIVAGFLTAASGGDDFGVAKQYLTRQFAPKWKPTSGVLVQADQAVTTGTGADISVRVPISAQITARGVYTPSSGDKTLPFHLVQQNGQWRIDSARDGIVLSQTVFQQNYAPRTIEFFDPTWTRLVPDRRWFASTLTSAGSGPSARAIVSALIAGPSGPVADGVTVNALAGATLNGIGPSTSGVTTVTLTVPGRTPDASRTTRIQQQLVQSLGLPTPSALRLVVNSVVAPQAKALADQLTPAAYVLLGDRFGTLSAGAFTPDRTLGTRIAASRPTAITVSLRQRSAAVLTAAGDVAIIGTSGATVVDTRPGLVAPTMDQRGWVYSVPSTSPSDGLQVANAKKQRFRLADDLGGATVTAIQVSPDGTRLLVLVASASGRPRAYVAGIQRNAAGAPIGLTAAQYPVDLGAVVGAGSSATWIDDSDVAVLISGSDNDRVVSQQLGGFSGALGQYANVTSIVGTNSTDDLRIRISTGDLYVLRDTTWQQETDAPVDVSVLAVQR
jgi:hypothetical protein